MDSRPLVIICYLLTKRFPQCSVSLNTRDTKIVVRAILVSGDWDPRFMWVFIYKHDITFCV